LGGPESSGIRGEGVGGGTITLVTCAQLTVVCHFVGKTLRLLLGLSFSLLQDLLVPQQPGKNLGQELFVVLHLFGILLSSTVERGPRQTHTSTTTPDALGTLQTTRGGHSDALLVVGRTEVAGKVGRRTVSLDLGGKAKTLLALLRKGIWR
jgi:hypothetical protein